MNLRIHPVQLGFDTCYLLQGEGTVLIDGGVPKQGRRFSKILERLSVAPESIRLMVITHGHFDHIGSARDIRAITGAKIAMHAADKDCLEKSTVRLPVGATRWGRLLVGTGGGLWSLLRVFPTDVDVVIDDGGMSLAGYGIPGRVVHTPGHTSGSVSVLLETEEAFVGDLAMNRFPLRIGPGLPVIAEDFQKVKESWRILLEAGAKRIYPAHGRPFPVGVIRKALGKSGPIHGFSHG
jgi:hydroxyacylglutathione hydrolase